MSKSKLEKFLTIALFSFFGGLFSMKCVLTGNSIRERVEESANDGDFEGMVANETNPNPTCRCGGDGSFVNGFSAQNSDEPKNHG